MNNNSSDILKQLKQIQYQSNHIYDLWLKEVDTDKKHKLSMVLDDYDKQERELKDIHHKIFQQECYDEHMKLLREYGNNKYKVMYRNGVIEFINHRKDIDYTNVVSVMQLMRKESCYVSECNAISISEDKECHTYYNDNKINSVKCRQIYVKGKLVTEEIYRDNFRYIIGYNYRNSLLEFCLTNSISIKYYKTNNEEKCIIELFIRSKYKYIDIVCKEYMDKIRTRVKQLRKDKFIDMDYILNYFDM